MRSMCEPVKLSDVHVVDDNDRDRQDRSRNCVLTRMNDDFRSKMSAIMRDATLSHEEKAKAMQALQTQGSKWAAKVEDEISPGAKG